MEPRNWSAQKTLRALRRAGITPRVHPDGDRLALPKGQRRLLTKDLSAALRANHADLLRGELFRGEILALEARLEDEGLGDAHPARETIYRALGQDGSEERLNDAWDGDGLDGFKAALAAWAAPAYEALEAALLPEEGGAPEERAEPALLADEPSRSAGAA